MPASILDPNISLQHALEEATSTHTRLEANPLTAAFASDFDPFFQDWKKTNDQEIKLRTALVKASAVIAMCDDDLDELVDAVSQGVLLDAKNDRKSPQYQLYFAAKPPNELKKPVLGPELETVRAWIPSLLASSSKVLTGFGAALKQKVAAADSAVAAQATAEQKNRDFRTIGERKALIDSLNALRKSTYGKLSELPHAYPDKHLPATFAEPFFRHDSAKKPQRPPTAADLALQVSTTEAQLIALKDHLTQAIAAEDAAARAKRDAAADDAALAQAEREAADAAAKVAALKAKKKA